MNGWHQVEPVQYLSPVQLMSAGTHRSHLCKTMVKQSHSKSTSFYQDHLIRRVDARVLTLKAWFGLVMCPWSGLVMCPRALFWSRLRYHFVILSASSGNSGMAYSHLFVTFLIPPDITLSFYQVWSLVATAVWRTLIFSSAFPRRHSHRCHR